MIINIRGTSGSGKSHLVRSLMELYGSRSRVMEEDRRQPIGYVLNNGGRSLAVLGHYETPCGGCDTIPKMDKIFQLVRDSHNNGMDVVFEGLLISADIKRTLALHEEGLPLKVVALDTPIEACLAGINDRRSTRMGDKYTPVNPKNTESKFKGVKSSMAKLQEAGVAASWASRADALNIVREALKI